MGRCDRGRWRIVATSNEQLARILEVSATAVAKAEESDRITREPGGEWSVLDVVRQWREGVNQFLQRDPSPWTDPQVDLDALDVTILTRRSRYAGARVELQAEGEDDAWQPIADPVQRVNHGETFDPDESAADCLGIGELNGLVPGAGYWLHVPEMTAPIVAKLAGVSKTKARAALKGAIAVALLWRIAAAEEKALGPADAVSIRHGRIPLASLTAARAGGARLSRPPTPRKLPPVAPPDA